jgi:polyribonucleotide nucleotidyltransferase
MAKALTGARGDVAATAPRISIITVPKDKIREVIGTGGKVIREIVEQTKCKIDIDDDGTIKIAAVDASQAQAAIDWIAACRRAGTGHDLQRQGREDGWISVRS